MGASTTLLMLGSSFGFALCGTCTKAAGRRISTHEKLFLRSILILCFLLVEHGVTGIKGTIARVPPRHRLLLLMRGTAGFIALTAYFEGSMLMPLSTMTVTTRIHPVLSTIGGAIFLGEKAPSSTWISLLLALVGNIFVSIFLSDHGTHHQRTKTGTLISSSLVTNTQALQWIASQECHVHDRRSGGESGGSHRYGQ
jgi:drug/metabolite transporter (DMT)-like permease